MFTIRPYRGNDAAACGACFYEGFFSCPVDENDKALLRDYAQIMIERCNFTYVAEAENHEVVGFICGKYTKEFSRILAARHETKRHVGFWCRKLVKFCLKRYKLSAPFQRQFTDFVRQAQERDNKILGACDLELVALSSKKEYRRGLGSALMAQFLERAKADGADHVRLFTNTLVSWKFYEKRGFKKVAEKPFQDGSGNRSFVYEYVIKEHDQKEDRL